MRGRGELAGAAAIAALMVAGCSQTVDGDARRARAAGPDSDRSYGYVDDRCGLLQDETVRDIVGAESVVRPYSGAVCQYALSTPTGVVDVVFSWFDTGSLDRERAVATERGASVTDREVERHPAFVARRPDGPAACSLTAAAGQGVLTWWVQFRPPTAADPCEDAEKLLAATLSADL